jgi:hypothetical protein
MNHDQQSVLAAYDDAIKKLYATLFDAYAQAAGDPAQEQQADQNFKQGVGFAQRSRDRAVALLA